MGSKNRIENQLAVLADAIAVCMGELVDEAVSAQLSELAADGG